MSAPVALVTGASSGIGASTARRLHALGYRVYAAARRMDRMADLADLGVTAVSTDLTHDADMVALVDRIVDESGRIDVLVNNAGYGSYGSLEDVPMDEAGRKGPRRGREPGQRTGGGRGGDRPGGHRQPAARPLSGRCRRQADGAGRPAVAGPAQGPADHWLLPDRRPVGGGFPGADPGCRRAHS